MLRIGDFARLGRVTVKTLRHYDEEGLLAPAEIDPATGYRFYSPEQLVALSRILQLRDLGFSVAEIRTLAADPAKLGAAIARRRAELSASIAADQEKLARLEAIGRGVDAPAIVVKPVEPVLALTAREAVDPASDRIARMFDMVERDAARALARADASPFMLFHESADAARMDVEVCVPLKGDMPGARMVEGAKSAGTLVYRGAYQQTPDLFATLAAWIDANGAAIGGPLREVYHRFGADQVGYRLPARMLAKNGADYVTELIAPIG